MLATQLILAASFISQSVTDVTPNGNNSVTPSAQPTKTTVSATVTIPPGTPGTTVLTITISSFNISTGKKGPNSPETFTTTVAAAQWSQMPTLPAGTAGQDFEISYEISYNDSQGMPHSATGASEGSYGP